MPKRLPPPFKPLATIARTASPDQVAHQRQLRVRRGVVAASRELERAHEEVVEEVQRVSAQNPTLTITAEVTIPQREGYAKRLQNLIRSLRASLEEEAPWLDNIEITISAAQ